MQRPPNKSLGQHWLHDAAALAAMLEAAEIKAGDTVLEIGPGLGGLTELLLNRSKRVVAVELDKQLAKNLAAKLQAPNLSLVQQDILSFDFSKLPKGYKLAANIPYYLTSKLVRVLSESPNPPKLAALLVQKEVAERLAAAPGELSILGVTAQYYWQISLGRVVEASLFLPPPKVDSQIVIMRWRQQPLFENVNQAEFFRLVRAGFSQKRKTLLNSLSAGLRLDRQATAKALARAGLNPSARAQTLSLEAWHRLYLALCS